MTFTMIGDRNLKRNPGRSFYTGIMLFLLSFFLITIIGIAGGINVYDNPAIKKYDKYDYELSIYDSETYLNKEEIEGVAALDSVAGLNAARDGMMDFYATSKGIIEQDVIEVYVYDDDMMRSMCSQNQITGYDSETPVCYGVQVERVVPEELMVYRQNGEEVHIRFDGIVQNQDEYLFRKANNGYVMIMNEAKASDLSISTDRNLVLITLAEGSDISEVRDFLEAREISMDYMNLKDIGKDSLAMLSSIVYIAEYILGCIIIMTIINLISNVYVNINLRKQEYGILYALGMSTKQLIKLIRYEIISLVSTKYLWSFPFSMFVATNVLY